MNISAKTLTAALLVGLASPVAASPAFDAFRQVCGDTRADFAAVKSAVASGGWSPTEAKSATMEGVTVTDSLARSKDASGAQLTLYAWHGVKGKVEVSACTVRVTALRFDDLNREAKAWAGFAPQAATSQKSSFQFSDTGSARTALDKSGYEAAAAGPGLELFTVSAVGADTIFDLLKIKS